MVVTMDRRGYRGRDKIMEPRCFGFRVGKWSVI